jgi:hypothetical protein
VALRRWIASWCRCERVLLVSSFSLNKASPFYPRCSSGLCGPCPPAFSFKIVLPFRASGRYFAGTYSEIASFETSCKPCAAGTYSDKIGASSCVKCAANTFQSGSGQSGCAACPAGEKSGVGSSGCSTCSANEYSKAGRCLLAVLVRIAASLNWLASPVLTCTGPEGDALADRFITVLPWSRYFVPKQLQKTLHRRSPIPPTPPLPVPLSACNREGLLSIGGKLTCPTQNITL